MSVRFSPSSNARGFSPGSNILNNEANYVEGIANASTDPANPPDAIIVSAGMGVAGAPTPVGQMPQVAALAATSGDSNGEVDLHWNPINRGLKSYVIEKTTDPAGQTGWTHAKVETKSSTAVTGLTSGTRYWFRVAAVGTAGQGGVVRSGDKGGAVNEVETEVPRTPRRPDAAPQLNTMFGVARVFSNQ